MVVIANYSIGRTSPPFVLDWTQSDSCPIGIGTDMSYISWHFYDDSPVYTDYAPRTYFGTSYPPPLVKIGIPGYAADEYTLPEDLQDNTVYYMRGWAAEYGYTPLHGFITGIYNIWKDFSRLPNYDETKYFDIATETWVTDINVAGGGRYQQQLVAVGSDDNGYGVIYYGDL